MVYGQWCDERVHGHFFGDLTKVIGSTDGDWEV